MSQSTTADEQNQTTQHVSADQLFHLIQGREELALIDVRETGAFAQKHLLYAVSVPLWRIEQWIHRKVPRKQVRIVLVDEQGALSAEAADLLARLGYTDVGILDGGIAAWQQAGYELFSGENVPSKAFGEVVEVKAQTPHISAAQLYARIQAGEPLVIVDGRTPEEFFNFSLPGAHNLPNAELPYRIRELAPDANTPIVVNCAGRTRSIIGAQTLIDAGVPNPIVSLRDGTMAWLLEGHALEHGKRTALPAPSASHLEQARKQADRLLDRSGVAIIDDVALARLQSDTSRSLFLFDIRSKAEYRAGHLPGWRWAPGGQLVQATDEYVGTLRARIVLTDWDGVRAATVAAWLVQLGQHDVYVYRPHSAAVLETGDEPLYLLQDPLSGVSAWISPDTLAVELAADKAVVVDVDSARSYAKRHIRSAWYVVAERIAQVADTLATDGKRLVITSADGVLADLVARRLSRQGLSVHALLGGNQAWFDAGLPTESGAERNRSGEEYAWFNAYDYDDVSLRNKKFQEYLDWEIGLVEQLARTGGEAPFTVLGATAV